MIIVSTSLMSRLGGMENDNLKDIFGSKTFPAILTSGIPLTPTIVNYGYHALFIYYSSLFSEISLTPSSNGKFHYNLSFLVSIKSYIKSYYSYGILGLKFNRKSPVNEFSKYSMKSIVIQKGSGTIPLPKPEWIPDFITSKSISKFKRLLNEVVT